MKTKLLRLTQNRDSKAAVEDVLTSGKLPSPEKI
jgi:hypothetical protein